MGIKDFYKHLKTKYPDCFELLYFSDLKYKKIAIDMMNLLYVYKARNSYDWLKLVVQFFIKLRTNFIHPICIFDGKSHILKSSTVEKRKNDRDKYRARILQLQASIMNYKSSGDVDQILSDFLSSRSNFLSILTKKPNVPFIEDYIEKQLKNYTIGFTKEDIEHVICILEQMGICTIIAEHDGEALCALLSKNKEVDFVLSNDSDVFFFGSKNAIINFTDMGGYLIRFDDILTKLELTEELFLDLCLLCGTDFNDSIRGVGFCKSLQLLKSYGSISGENFPLRSQLDYTLLEKVKELRNMNNTSLIKFSRNKVYPELEQTLFNYQIDIPIHSFEWLNKIIISEK